MRVSSGLLDGLAVREEGVEKRKPLEGIARHAIPAHDQRGFDGIKGAAAEFTLSDGMRDRLTGKLKHPADLLLRSQNCDDVAGGFEKGKLRDARCAVGGGRAIQYI